MKWHLSKATYISVRDEDSFLYLKELGMKRDIELVPDPVLTWKRKKQSDWLQKTFFAWENNCSECASLECKRRLYKKS